MIYETIVAPVLAASLAIGIIFGQVGALSFSGNLGYYIGFYGFGSQLTALLLSLLCSVMTARQLPWMSTPGLCYTIMGGLAVSSLLIAATGRSLLTSATISPSVSSLLYWFLLEKNSESLKKLLFWSYNKVRGTPDTKWEM